MSDVDTWKSPQACAELYDSPFTSWYQAFSDSHCHFGYWQDPDQATPLLEAVHRLSELHLEAIRVGPGQRFLDVGCGLGRMAVLVAQRTGCQVDGVTISKRHYDGAVAHAEAHGLGDRVRFHVADANAMPFPDGTFDAACFIESLLHIGYRGGLKEVSRVLKPGGEVMVSDFPALRPQSPEEVAFYREAWCANDILPLDEQKQIFDEAGFDVVRIRDLTKHTVVPGFRAWQGVLQSRRDEVVAACGPELANDFTEALPKMCELAGTSFGYSIYELRKR